MSIARTGSGYRILAQRIGRKATHGTWVGRTAIWLFAQISAMSAFARPTRQRRLKPPSRAVGAPGSRPGSPGPAGQRGRP